MLAAMNNAQHEPDPGAPDNGRHAPRRILPAFMHGLGVVWQEGFLGFFAATNPRKFQEKGVKSMWTTGAIGEIRLDFLKKSY